MVGLLIIFIIASIIKAKVIINPDFPPIITAINDSYVYVEYKESFQNLNFSTVTKVELSKELQTELKTHGTKIDRAQFFMQLQKEDND